MDTNVPSAYQSAIGKYYKPEEFDQFPFQFPEQSEDHLYEPSHHNIQETTLKSIQEIMQQKEELPITSTLSTIFENTALNATQEVTSNATDIIFGQEMTTNNASAVTNNVTAVINEVFGNNSSSTEASLTNFTLDVGTDFTSNSTGSTDLVTLVNSTMSEVDSTYMPEHMHSQENTTLIILIVVISVLIISIIIGFLLYFYKKRMIKQAGNLQINAHGRRQSGHIVSFSENVTPSFDNSQCSSHNQTYVKSSKL